MARHTSFRFCLDLSVEQERVLSRHVGAARFAFNQALRLHKDARAAARRGQPPGPRWFPSSKTCSGYGTLNTELTLKDRTFECHECGHVMDRDLIAAVDLATWAENHTPPVDDGAGRGVARVGDRQAAGPVTNAHRQDTPTRHDVRRRGGKGLDDVGTSQTAPTA